MADLALRDKRDIAIGNPQEEKLIDVKGELTKYHRLTSKEMYPVGGGRKAPSARLAQYWANMRDLHSEPVHGEVGKDKWKAWAMVRGWQGKREEAEATSSFRYAYVCHVFSELLAESVLDAIANGLQMPSGDYYPSGAPRIEKRYLDDGDYEIGDGGWPIITNKAIQLQVMRNHLAKIKFAERDALTKAERAVYLKLLNSPWQEKPGDGEEESRSTPDSDKKTDLGSLKQHIWSALMSLSGGKEFGPILKSVSIISDPQSGKIIFPEVNSIESITSLEHAEEIMARIEAKLAQKEEEQ